MKIILYPPSELLPAAEGAQRMVGTLESLQAEVEQIFSGMPRLLALLMQLFALLRRAQIRQADSVAEVPDLVAPVGARAVRASGVRVGRSRRGRKHAADAVVAVRQMASRVCFEMVWMRIAGGAGVAAFPPKIFQKIAEGKMNKHAHFVTLSQLSAV